jgi:hypothetical protein
MSPGRAPPCRERPEAVKPWRRAARTPGARSEDALRVPFTTARPQLRGPPSSLTARAALSRVPPRTVNATGRVGHCWAGLATAGQVRVRAAHLGSAGARRVRCRVVRVVCIMPPTVPKPGALGHWARSGVFRRIQADPGRSLQSPRFTLEHARTPDKRGAVERARTAGMVAAEVISPWSAPASDRGRSGALIRPGQRAALRLASPAHRQS